MRKITLIAVMLLLCGSAMAQDFSFSGQFRERTEFDAKMIGPGGSMDVFHLLRTRFSANAAVNENVTVFIELQDARAYGTEGTLLNTGASGLDLRQGFVKVTNLGGSVFDAKLGRTVLAYANERIIGAFDWSNFGRSFDAAVVTAKFKNFKVDLIGAAVNRNENVATDGETPLYNRDEFLTGLWAVWNPTGDQNSVQPFFLYDNPISTIEGLGSTRVRRYTTGVYTNWAFGKVDVTVEGAYQFGELPDVMLPNDPETAVSLGAYMVGVRAGYTLKGKGKVRVGVGLDILSGNAAPDRDENGDLMPDETIEAWSNLHPTNHKFYGFMDYFTNFPGGLMGAVQDPRAALGLMDIIFQLSATPREGHKVGLDFHILSTAVDPLDFIPEGQERTDSKLSTSIGMELDLWCSFAIAKAVWATFGFSIFDFADRAEYPLSNYYLKTTKWGWIQIMVNI